MKASNSTGVSQYSLGLHKFIINVFIPVIVVIMAITAVCSLVMFFMCGLYDTLKISDLIAQWTAQLEGKGMGFMTPVMELFTTICTSLFSLTGGLAPAMHIRHLTICYLSVGVAVVGLMARNALMYFEKKALTLLNSFLLAIGGYVIVFGWLFQYVLTNFVSIKPRVLTDASIFGVRIFAYINTYYKLFTSSFFKDNLFTGKLFDGILIPSVHFPDGRDLFADIALVQKYLANSEMTVAVITVVSLAAISGLLVLFATLYYKKRKSLFEFSI